MLDKNMFKISRIDSTRKKNCFFYRRKVINAAMSYFPDILNDLVLFLY